MYQTGIRDATNSIFLRLLNIIADKQGSHYLTLHQIASRQENQATRARLLQATMAKRWAYSEQSMFGTWIFGKRVRQIIEYRNLMFQNQGQEVGLAGWLQIQGQGIRLGCRVKELGHGVGLGKMVHPTWLGIDYVASSMYKISPIASQLISIQEV